MDKKILDFLGIARRAGRLSLGTDAVMEAVNKKKSKLIITACDISRIFRNTYGELWQCHRESCGDYICE